LSGTEPLTGARIPTQTDGPLGGLQIANATTDIAPATVPYFATASARDTAFSAWVAAGHTMRNGLHCHVQGIGDMEYAVGTGWIKLGARQRFWTFARAGIDSTFVSGSYQAMMSGTITGAPAGDYAITARLTVANTAVVPGFHRTEANAVSISPTVGDPRADPIVANGRVAFVMAGGYTHTGGDLAIYQYYKANSGTPTIFTQGTELAVYYLGPRTI
jgi:hypothetical protein